MKKYGYTKKAAEETIRICKDKDILAEYLKERAVEVMDIMNTLFDQDEVTRRYQVVNRISHSSRDQTAFLISL